MNTRATTSIAEYVDWLDAVFDALGLDQGINLLGLSLGVWLFAEYALHAPQRIGKMICACLRAASSCLGSILARFPVPR